MKRRVYFPVIGVLLVILMTDTSFWQIATTREGTMVACGEYERIVHVFELATGKRIARFESDLDSGGSRLAIDPNGKYCAVGSYDHKSLTLTDLHGRMCWRRADLGRIDRVAFTHDGDLVLCSYSHGVVCQFDVRTGEMVRFTNSKRELLGATWVLRSPHDDFFVIDQVKHEILVADHCLKRVAILKRKTFGMIGNAFAPEFLCISESGGPVTCYHLPSGREVWELRFEEGVHAVGLEYNEESRHFSAVTWPYVKGGPHVLLAIGECDGRVLMSTRLPDSACFGFVGRGTKLILGDGQIYSTAAGECIGALEFVG